MELLFLSLALLLLSGLCSLLSRWLRFLPSASGPVGAIAASVLGVISSAYALCGPAENFCRPWPLPGAALSLSLDPLAALFLLPLFILSAACAVYSLRYVEDRKNWSYFLFNILTAAMALVFTASNAVLFLLAWEAMTLASFLFVVWDHSDADSRAAGWLYLVATHIGTAFLLILFTLAWNRAGSAEFSAFPAAFRTLPFAAVAVLAILGFGTKAGFFPLHVWLPKAHPAAPSHVSALMSGIMIKTGIYGLLRVISLCPPPPQWFGWVLIGIGAVSGLVGVLFALAQRDLKQMLAYSSVENIGIITLGLGVGYTALYYGHPATAFLGFAGAFLHVINHALFKGLLFLGAGAVYHSTGTRDMETLGGLRRSMPVTAACMLVGSAAISALPPFNGFLGELLIYASAFKTLPAGGPGALAGLLALAALAAIGALAAACFAKAFGVTFLGMPRRKLEHEPHEAPKTMLAPMLALAALCAVGGLIPMIFSPFIYGAAGQLLAGLPQDSFAAAILRSAALAGLALAALAALLWILRDKLLAGRKNAFAPTWGCAYQEPTPRMQYSASSFSQSLLETFGIGDKTELEAPQGLFPRQAAFHSELRDMAGDGLYRPLFEILEDKLSLLRKIQHGNIHAYVLYIAVTLVVLLGWALL